MLPLLWAPGWCAPLPIRQELVYDYQLEPEYLRQFDERFVTLREALGGFTQGMISHGRQFYMFCFRIIV